MGRHYHIGHGDQPGQQVVVQDMARSILKENISLLLVHIQTSCADFPGLNALQQRLELLSYSGIAQKAAYYLLMQRKKTGSDIIPIPGSMTKWAMLLNVSRPSLHRELKHLEAQNTIQIQKHQVEILNPNVLQGVLTQ